MINDRWHAVFLSHSQPFDSPLHAGPPTETKLIIIPIPPLLPPLIIRIPQPSPRPLHLIPKPLRLPNPLPSPPSNLLRRILHIINRIVEAALDPVAKVTEPLLDSLRRMLDVVDGIVEAAFDSVAEIIEALLDVVRDLFRFAYAATGPFGGVLGEIGGGVF